MKPIFTLIVSAVISTTAFHTVLADNKYTDTVPDVYIDNIKIDMTIDKPIIDENDRLLIPVRTIGEAIGASVDWDPSRGNGRVTITGTVNCTVFDIGSNVAFLNGTRIYMDTSAQIINDRTYVPLRYIGESMNYEVNAASDMSRIDLVKKADNPAFIQEDGQPPEYILRGFYGDLDTYGCEVEVYSGNDIPEEWLLAFVNKDINEQATPLSYDEFFENAPPVYSLGSTVYSEKLNSTDNKNGLHYSAFEIRNLSDDILIEYIPDNVNATGEITIELHKNYYTKTAELTQEIIAEVTLPANEHSIAKIMSIYNDNYIAPFFGVDANAGYWIDYKAAKDDYDYSGTLRITCLGEPINGM